jgi:hypothetical protein
MAMLRVPRSLEFLFDVIRAGNPGTAIGAIEALKIYRNDSTLRGKILEALTASEGAELRRAFDRHFGPA